MNILLTLCLQCLWQSNTVLVITSSVPHKLKNILVKKLDSELVTNEREK